MSNPSLLDAVKEIGDQLEKAEEISVNSEELESLPNTELLAHIEKLAALIDRIDSAHSELCESLGIRDKYRVGNVVDAAYGMLHY